MTYYYFVLLCAAYVNNSRGSFNWLGRAFFINNSSILHFLPPPFIFQFVVLLVCKVAQGYGFSSSHVWMWDNEDWVSKNWCFWIVMLEKTLESALESKVIKPVNPKGNQPWILIGRTDAEAEATILWPSDAKTQLTGKDPDAGKDWGQEEKGTTETDGITDSMDMSLSKFQEIVKDREWGHKSWTWLNDWSAITRLAAVNFW